MAASTQYGANYATAKAATPATLLRTAQHGGKLRLQVDVATLSANSDIGSLVYVATLPKGAVPIATIVQSPNVSNAVTGTIGWSGDADALGTFTTLATHLAQLLVPTVPNEALSEAKEVYITVAGANAEAEDEIIATILYATAD